MSGNERVRRSCLSLFAVAALLMTSQIVSGQSRKAKLPPRQTGEVERHVTSASANYSFLTERNGVSGQGQRAWNYDSTSSVLFEKVSKSGKIEQLSLRYKKVAEKGLESKKAIPLPVSGKAYYVEYKKRSPKVRTAKGKRVPADQQARVAADLKAIQSETLAGLLNLLKKHQRFSGGKAEAQQFFRLPDGIGFRVDKMDWTRAEEKAVDDTLMHAFDTKGLVQVTLDGLAVPVEVSGTLLYRADSGRPYKWKLTGDIQYETAGTVGANVIEARVQGKLSLECTHDITIPARVKPKPKAGPKD